MRSSQASATRRRLGRRAAWTVPAIALVFGATGCGSDAESGAGALDTAAGAPATTEAPTTAAPTNTAPTGDAGIAAAALLSPDDLPADWRLVGPEFYWPNSAELARQAPDCVSFADLVFEGGAQHGQGATETLQRLGTEQYVFMYVVVFPTAAEAAAMVAAIDSAAFDPCWAAFNKLGAMAMPLGITDANYETATPPELNFNADSYTVKMVTGTAVVGGATFGDSCLCVFAQVGRAVVEVHSAAEVLDIEDRTAVTQAAIDRLRTTLG